MSSTIFFLNDTATTEIYTLSLHDALPICLSLMLGLVSPRSWVGGRHFCSFSLPKQVHGQTHLRSEEHTSELQSRQYLVCRLLLETKHARVVVLLPLHLDLVSVHHLGHVET